MQLKKYEEFLDKVLLQFSTIQEYVDTGDFAQASIALGSDFQNLVRDMGEKTETNLTENLEGGISEQSKLYNQAVDMNIQVTNIICYIYNGVGSGSFDYEENSKQTGKCSQLSVRSYY